MQKGRILSGIAHNAEMNLIHRIANQVSGDGNDFWGVADEVRISDTLLSKEELLIYSASAGTVFLIK